MVNTPTSSPSFLKDLSFWSLVIANGFVIYLAVANSWGFFDTFISIWSQTVIIGFFSIIKVVRYSKSAPNNHLANKEVVGKTLDIYLLFPIGYAIFLFVIHAMVTSLQGSVVQISISSLLISAAVFFINHLFSFIYSNHDELSTNYFLNQINLAKNRIVPMHLAIIFSMFSMIGFGNLLILNGFFVIFMLALKSIIDISVHVKAHSKKQNQHVIVN